MSGSVDSDRAGVYVLTYTAVDSEGNEAKPDTNRHGRGYHSTGDYLIR